MQYVNFNGLNNAAPILNEHPFKGPIVRMLSQIDLFIETSIARKRPVPVTALREKTVFDYPKAAIRELLMNAIMHRDYQGNARNQLFERTQQGQRGLQARDRPERA